MYGIIFQASGIFISRKDRLKIFSDLLAFQFSEQKNH